MLTYISHPFNGEERNKEAIEGIVEELVEDYPDETFVSPVHAFGYLYDSVDYDAGLNMCLDLLEVCDYMIVFGNYKQSRGCMAEIRYAEQNNIPFEIREEDT